MNVVEIGLTDEEARKIGAYYSDTVKGRLRIKDRHIFVGVDELRGGINNYLLLSPDNFSKDNIISARRLIRNKMHG